MKSLLPQTIQVSPARASTTTPPNYKRTEVGVIPQDWDHVRVGDVARVKGGKRLPSGLFLIDTPTPHPYIRVTDMYPGGVNHSNIKYLPERAFLAIRNYRIFSNDIFISVAGTLGIIGVVQPELSGANLTENADRITDIRCNRDYLMYWLMSQPIQQTIESIRTVGAQPKLALGRITKFDVAVPQNTAEQRAIAEALSDMDGLLGALETLIAKKRAIKQAAMQQLLTGKTRLPGFRGAWVGKPLSNLAAITMGQSPPSIFYNVRGEGLPLIQGNTDIDDRRTIDRVWTTQATKRCDLGDLLLTVRAPVGVVAVANKNACLGRGVCGLKPFADSRFLFHALVHAEKRWQILEQGSTFTAANSEQVGKIRLSVPDDENEQRAIAAVLSDMDAESAALERRRDKTRAIKQGMMQALLTGRVRLVRPESASEQEAETIASDRGSVRLKT